MSLFRFELKKLLFNKKTLILFAVLLILYAAVGFLVSYFSFGGQSNYAIYQKLADAHTGQIDPVQAAASNKVSDDTKIRFGNNSDALSEAGYHDPVIKFNLNYADYAKYADEYYNGASTDSASAPYGINNLQKKVDSLEQNGDSSSFEYRKTVRQLETETSVGEPVFDNTSLWINLFNNWGTYIVLFLLFIPLGFIIAPVFSMEASTGMDNLILSSKHGRKKIVTAKLASVVITSAMVVMIYVAATFFANFLAMGSFAGATAALRSVAAYVRAPFAMDVWQFAVVSVLWLLFMGIVFGIVVAFVSSKIKSQLGTFGIGLALLLSSLILDAFGSNFAAIIKPLIDFSLSSVFQTADIFGKFSVYNVFGIIVPYWAAALGLMAILCSIGIWAIYYFQKRRIAA